MSHNPRIELNIVRRYWQRVPMRKLGAVLAKMDGQKLSSETEYYTRETMRELGLALYSNVVSDMLMIGFTNTDQHDHDRWLLTTRDTPEGLFWLRAAPENLGRMSAYHVLPQAVSDLHYHCNAAIAVYMRRSSQTNNLSKPDLLRRLQLVNFDPTVVFDLPEHLNLHEAHRLLNHYPRWQARHPEFRELPQALALRMHGLGGILDAGYKLEGA